MCIVHAIMCQGQARREVGSADSREASPPPGFARESSAQYAVNVTLSWTCLVFPSFVSVNPHNNAEIEYGSALM